MSTRLVGHSECLVGSVIVCMYISHQRYKKEEKIIGSQRFLFGEGDRFFSRHDGTHVVGLSFIIGIY